MARGVRLPGAAGRRPRFLRTGHRRAISLNEAHLQAARRDAGHTLEREAEGILQWLCSIGQRGASERKGDIPRPGRGRPRRRRDVRFRGGPPAAAEVADAASATALRPEGPCCAKVRRCPDCPIGAVSEPGFVAGDVAPSASKQKRHSPRWRCSTPLSLRVHGTAGSCVARSVVGVVLRSDGHPLGRVRTSPVSELSLTLARAPR
jgi:hypothetical protein